MDAVCGELETQFGRLDLVAIQEACVAQAKGSEYAIPMGKWRGLTNTEQRGWDTAIGMSPAMEECMVRRGEGRHWLSAAFRITEGERISVVNCHFPTSWGEGVD